MTQSGNVHRFTLMNWLFSLAKFSVIVISIVMVVVTLAQVIFRYLIEAPLPWSEELARYCFVWIVFLGAAIGLARGIHLGVDIFVNLLPQDLQTGISILCNVIIGCFAIAVIYASLPVVKINTFQHSPALGVQMSYIYIAIPISMCLIVLVCLERIYILFQVFRERKA